MKDHCSHGLMPHKIIITNYCHMKDQCSPAAEDRLRRKCNLCTTNGAIPYTTPNGNSGFLCKLYVITNFLNWLR